MKAEKAYVKQKLIEFQLKIAELGHRLSEQQDGFEKKQEDHYLGLFEILDAFEILEESIEDRKDQMDKPARMLCKNIRSIHRKLVRLMKVDDIVAMAFTDNNARMDHCIVVETRPDPELAAETIVKVVKNGYINKSDGTVLRKAEVITVSNE